MSFHHAFKLDARISLSKAHLGRSGGSKPSSFKPQLAACTPARSASSKRFLAGFLAVWLRHTRNPRCLSEERSVAARRGRVDDCQHAGGLL